ncbi:MAG TPA: hypothetical protein VET26_11320 [Candidatus Sulfotelmatobacter sp.]|nr:hypothetical protein [Candidatus Sulfotelmatobacter sp.]
MLEDLRAIITDDYRAVIARVGPQAGSIAHLLHRGAEATLCGVPKSSLATFEDLDEPICPRCIEWLHRQPRSGWSRQAVS